MIFKRTRLFAALVIALALTPVQGSAPDRIGRYDFSYSVAGDARVRPVQVFDNGVNTYFQFRPSEPVPAIFAEAPGGPLFLVPELEGPYVKLPSVASGYVLRLGYGAGRVTYTGGARGKVPQAPASPVTAARPQTPEPGRPSVAEPSGAGAYLPKAASAAVPVPESMATPELPSTQSSGTVAGGAQRLLAASRMISGLPRDMFKEPPRPSLEADSYATPLRGDLVEWTDGAERVREIEVLFPADGSRLSPAALKAIRAAVQSAKPNTKFEVLARDDAGHKEKVAEARGQAVSTALYGSGALRQAVKVRYSHEAREAGKGQWVGATLRIIDSAPLAARQPSAAVDVGSVAEQLRSGAITPSRALELLQAQQAPAAAPSQTPAVWAIRKSDETVERLLARWAKQAGWNLVWRGGPVIPITGDAELVRPQLVQAADYVVSQARSAGYRIQATAYLGGTPTLLVTGESN